MGSSSREVLDLKTNLAEPNPPASARASIQRRLRVRAPLSRQQFRRPSQSALTRSFGKAYAMDIALFTLSALLTWVHQGDFVVQVAIVTTSGLTLRGFTKRPISIRTTLGSCLLGFAAGMLVPQSPLQLLRAVARRTRMCQPFDHQAHAYTNKHEALAAGIAGIRFGYIGIGRFASTTSESHWSCGQAK